MSDMQIRLGCLLCIRDDHDGIDSIPADWCDVERIQTYDESCADVDPDDPVASVLDWETHIGVCPECQGLENRLHEQLRAKDAEIERLTAENSALLESLRRKDDYIQSRQSMWDRAVKESKWRCNCEVCEDARRKLLESSDE